MEKIYTPTKVLEELQVPLSRERSRLVNVTNINFDGNVLKLKVAPSSEGMVQAESEKTSPYWGTYLTSNARPSDFLKELTEAGTKQLIVYTGVNSNGTFNNHILGVQIVKPEYDNAQFTRNSALTKN